MCSQWRLNRDMTEGESPLGQAIQPLALMQESTTVLQRQQSEALLEIASVQREDRALLRELLQRPANREVEPVTGPAAADCPTQDDSQGRPGGLAAHSLPASSRHNYHQLRRAILDRLSSTPEGHRLRFRALPFEDAGRPFSYAQQLLDIGGARGALG
ncbi:hypothetical protein NQZ68_019390, partial [Dissostichus eleginoides]